MLYASKHLFVINVFCKCHVSAYVCCLEIRSPKVKESPGHLSNINVCMDTMAAPQKECRPLYQRLASRTYIRGDNYSVSRQL